MRGAPLLRIVVQPSQGSRKSVKEEVIESNTQVHLIAIKTV